MSDIVRHSVSLFFGEGRMHVELSLQFGEGSGMGIGAVDPLLFPSLTLLGTLLLKLLQVAQGIGLT